MTLLDSSAEDASTAAVAAGAGDYCALSNAHVMKADAAFASGSPEADLTHPQHR